MVWTGHDIQHFYICQNMLHWFPVVILKSILQYWTLNVGLHFEDLDTVYQVTNTRPSTTFIQACIPERISK